MILWLHFGQSLVCRTLLPGVEKAEPVSHVVLMLLNYRYNSNVFVPDDHDLCLEKALFLPGSTRKQLDDSKGFR